MLNIDPCVDRLIQSPRFSDQRPPCGFRRRGRRSPVCGRRQRVSRLSARVGGVAVRVVRPSVTIEHRAPEPHPGSYATASRLRAGSRAPSDTASSAATATSSRAVRFRPGAPPLMIFSEPIESEIVRAFANACRISSARRTCTRRRSPLEIRKTRAQPRRSPAPGQSTTAMQEISTSSPLASRSMPTVARAGSRSSPKYSRYTAFISS